jgi:glycosyltransferase involved in cell wall biosynthesis
MRILILCHNLIERGNYFRALKFALFLANKGHDVTFIPSSYRWYKPNRYKKGNLQIIESPSYSFIIGRDDGWSPLGILYRIGIILRKKFDIVYGFSHKPVDFIPAFFSRLFRGSYYISDWCDWWGKGGLLSMIKSYRDKNPKISRFRKMILSLYESMEASLEQYVPKRAHLVTVICKALYQRALDIGIPRERILHLISGADLDNIKPMNKQKARDAIRLSSYLPPRENGKDWIVLGYTANYHLDEHLLLETFSRVCSKMKNVLLLVVGPEFRIKESQMAEWGIEIRDASFQETSTRECQIIHFGRKPFKDIPLFLAASDILLLPLSDIVYNKGRWPHKIGDYLSSGRPVVVNDVGDIPDLIRGKNAGFVAEPNPEDFPEKIIRLIRERDYWDENGKNARNIAETQLNWETICNKLYTRLRESLPIDKKKKL